MALAFESDGKFVASIGLPYMAQLQRRHGQLCEANLSEDVVALLKRYKHGNDWQVYGALERSLAIVSGAQ